MTFNASVNPDNAHFSQSGSILSLDATVPLSYATDAGSATASSHVLNILGTAGASTSGSGNTITVEGTDVSVTPDPFDPTQLFLPENAIETFFWQLPYQNYRTGNYMNGRYNGPITNATMLEDLSSYPQCGGRLGIVTLNTSPGTAKLSTITGWGYGTYWSDLVTSWGDQAFGFDIYIDQISNWGAGATAFFGCTSNNQNEEPDRGMYFFASLDEGPNWFIRYRTDSGSAPQSTDTGVPVAVGWVKLALAMDQAITTVEYFIEGVSVGSFTGVTTDGNLRIPTIAQYANRAEILVDTIYYLNNANSYI